jgi:hypothetical protein
MPEVSTELPSASSLSGSSNLSESIQPCQELDLYSMLLQYSTGSEVLDLIWAIQLQDSGVVTRMPRPYLDTVILFLTWNILVILFMIISNASLNTCLPSQTRRKPGGILRIISP